jgi:hypothetical protein
MITFCKLYLSFLYNGLSEDRILELKVLDIDYKNNIIFDSNVAIKMYEVTRKYLKIIEETKELAVQRRNAFIYILLENNNKVIRLKDNDNRKLLFKNKIVDLNKKYQSKTGNIFYLSTKRVFESGMFYRLYEMELSGAIIDSSLITQHFKINKNNMVSSSYLKKIADIKKDYENWKKIL